MGRLFGTDGVRGVAGSGRGGDLAVRVGRTAAAVLGRPGATQPPTCVVGRDTRESGAWLEDALTEGILDAGGHVLLAGIEPTPAIAFMPVDLEASSGVVISASHNPPADNGIKFFSREGMKLPDHLEDEIEADLTGVAPPATARGAVAEIPEGRERYLHHLEAAADARLDGMRIVVDCANGAASDVAPEILRRLGAEVIAINAEPDGRNINVGCGALHPDVVAAVMSNLGLVHRMRDAGIELVQAQVGDRYVLEEMERRGAMLGGEQSGHVIFREDATTGDGLLTAVRFLSLAAANGVSVGELARAMPRYPQGLVNGPVSDPGAAGD